MILLFFVLHYNSVEYRNNNNQASFIGKAFGGTSPIGGNTGQYVQWMEARTIMYLKISISDFLTLFSARTRTWFWERRPGYALGGACLVATGSSTLLALFWNKINTSSDAYMAGLAPQNGVANYAVLSTWIYCILWFFVQDIAKVVTYQLLERLTNQDTERVKEQSARGTISTLMDEDAKRARARGVTKAGAADGHHGGMSHHHDDSEVCGKGAGAQFLNVTLCTQWPHDAPPSHFPVQLATTVKSLQKEIAELRALIVGGAVKK